jgi:RNA polymerase sigma-70 factor (ECF subfamily)
MSVEGIRNIYSKHKTDLYRYVLSIVKNVHTAEDIVQDVFLLLIEKSGELKNPKAVRAWLFTSARNRAFDVLKKPQSENIDDVEIKENFNYNFEIFELLECLDETDREIVTLHISSGFKHKETAKILKLEESNVRQRYKRAIEKIRKNTEGLI